MPIESPITDYHNLPPILLDWDQIQTVFLDMDGTLLDLHFDNHFWLEHLPQRYAEQYALTPTKAQQFINKHCAQIEGTLNWYCLDYWQQLLQLDLVPLKHEIAGKIALRNHVEHFLKYLRQLDKRVVLLTNAHQKSIAVKFSYINLSPYFDQIITSHTLGVAKEHPSFWQRLSAIEHYQAAHSLFIDDNLAVLRNARQQGLSHLLAIREPDSQQGPKPTAEFIAIDSYTQLMHNTPPSQC